MKKLILSTFLLLTSLITFADGTITIDKGQFDILGGREYEYIVLDADGELMEIESIRYEDNSVTIHYVGKTSENFIIVKVIDRKTNKVVFLKYKKTI